MWCTLCSAKVYAVREGGLRFSRIIRSSFSHKKKTDSIVNKVNTGLKGKCGWSGFCQIGGRRWNRRMGETNGSSSLIKHTVQANIDTLALLSFKLPDDKVAQILVRLLEVVVLHDHIKVAHLRSIFNLFAGCI